jgi:hypothetical protein
MSSGYFQPCWFCSLDMQYLCEFGGLVDEMNLVMIDSLASVLLSVNLSLVPCHGVI